MYFTNNWLKLLWTEYGDFIFSVLFLQSSLVFLHFTNKSANQNFFFNPKITELSTSSQAKLFPIKLFRNLPIFAKPTFRYYSVSELNLYYFSIKLIISTWAKPQCHSLRPLQEQINNKTPIIFKKSYVIKIKDMANLGDLDHPKMIEIDPIHHTGNHQEKTKEMESLHLSKVRPDHQR